MTSCRRVLFHLWPLPAPPGDIQRRQPRMASCRRALSRPRTACCGSLAPPLLRAAFSGGGPPPDGILRRPAPDDILPQSPVPPLAPTCPSGRHSAAAAPDGILPQSPVPPSDGMLRQPGPPLASGGIQRRRPAPGDILPQDPPPPGRCGRSADRRARRSSDPCADGRKRRGSPRLRHFFASPMGLSVKQITA